MKYLFLFLFCLPSYAEEDNRIKVALLDTGINVSRRLSPYMCSTGHKDFTGTNLNDSHGHGTQLAKIISRRINPKTTCIVNIKILKSGNYEESLAPQALTYALSNLNNLKFVNLSFSGPNPIKQEYKAIKIALKENIKVVVAAGNDKKNLNKECSVWPACFKFANPGFYVAGSRRSNYGSFVRVLPGPWSSQAAARLTGRLASEH